MPAVYRLVQLHINFASRLVGLASYRVLFYSLRFLSILYFLTSVWFCCLEQVTMKTAKGKGAAKAKEALKTVDDRKVGKRKATEKADMSSKRKAKKEKSAKKDPNKPKRPPSAFFVFLEEFRKTFKKENPQVKAVSAVGKAGGEKWKSMSQAEKAPYEVKASKRKAEYERQMNAYNKKQESADDGDEEFDDEENEESVEEEDDDDGDEDD